MLTSDDFMIQVPPNGLPRFVDSDQDVVAYVEARVNRRVDLLDGRTVIGSVFRARESDAADELHIMDLITERFGQVKP